MSDIAAGLISIADASRRQDGSDIPLGQKLREAAAEIATLSAEVERLRNEADSEFVAAAVRVMRASPGFDHRDYQDGITADDFEMFFTEDMNEAWRLHEKERARAESAEARVKSLLDLLAKNPAALAQLFPQQPLDADMARIWSENIGRMYES